MDGIHHGVHIFMYLEMKQELEIMSLDVWLTVNDVYPHNETNEVYHDAEIHIWK